MYGLYYHHFSLAFVLFPRDESKLIQEIVADVRAKLQHIYNCQYALSSGLFGIDEIIKPIPSEVNKNIALIKNKAK